MGIAEDKLAILELHGGYSFAADERLEASEYADVFTEDGAFHGRVGEPDEVRIEGRDALLRFAAGLPSARSPAVSGDAAGRQSRHHQSSPVFLEIGPEHAVTRTYLMATGVAGGGAPAIALTSIYEDHLVKTPDGWRIKLRRAIPDVKGNLFGARRDVDANERND